MKLVRWLVLAAGLLLLRTGFTRFGPMGDVYLLVLVVGSAIAWELRRRRRGGDIIALGEQLAAIAAADHSPPSNDASPPSQAESEPTYLVFTYPPASRLRAYIAALLCGFFGIGFLLSLVLYPTNDPANSWLLFGLGIACLGGLVWSVWQLSWIGASLAVSQADLVHRSPSGHLTRLPWAALTGITRQQFPVSLTFSGSGSIQIRVYSPIATDTSLLQAVAAIVKGRAPGAS
jgi:hypothetical protein